MRVLAISAAVAAWFGPMALPAAAPAAGVGGAQAPSQPVAGGSEFGVDSGPPVAGRPVLRQFTVPRRAAAGGPPPIVLRVDEPGTPQVRGRVVVLSLPHHRAALRADLGEIVTGRSQALVWPRGARLGPGSYLVQFHAYDARGATLLREAHAAGSAVMTLVAPRRAASPTVPSPTSANPLHPPSFVPAPPGSTAPSSARAVFPVAGAHTLAGGDGRFGAGRKGHIHQGQDVLAAEGTPVVAPLAGAVIAASYQAAGAGYYVTERGSDGRYYFSAHCRQGSTAVAVGAAVAAGQRLCLVGHTGDASGPHLHFEIWIGGWHTAGSYPIDPLPVLESWERG